jgi:hypothetical protein
MATAVLNLIFNVIQDGLLYENVFVSFLGLWVQWQLTILHFFQMPLGTVLISMSERAQECTAEYILRKRVLSQNFSSTLFGST